MRYKVNEINISYKERITISSYPQINSSKDAAELLYETWDKNTLALQECFKVILLNNNNKVKGICQISQGGITGTLVDIRILFAIILKSLSVGIILTHYVE